MRVACRRLRSVLRSYRSVLDRKATDPVREELKWLGNGLGAERGQEVLLERLSSRIEALPAELVLGPVAARLQVWDWALWQSGANGGRPERTRLADGTGRCFAARSAQDARPGVVRSIMCLAPARRRLWFAARVPAEGLPSESGWD
ncbi:CHAD domain-containing protein [Streptomyces sp. NPDC091217]|uniref:CHAD domain-containing protein n=1 Tax=Streptomyces sp. NPDC091217 TaxID=3365975 RepID=UPI0037F2C24A